MSESDPMSGRPTARLIVAVGASAGGLEASKRLFQTLKIGQGLAFVVVMHLDPDQRSHISEILSRSTALHVVQATDGAPVEADHVYVIAPGTMLSIRQGKLEVGAPEQPHYRARPIDMLFSALAKDQGERAAGIILAGTGSDGTAGLEEVHRAGGLCLVQDPDTADYAGMPQSAIDTGVVDAVLAPEAMQKALVEYANPPHVRPRAPDQDRAPDKAPREGLGAILALVGERYGVDFRAYKRGTMERRTARRMHLLKIDDWRGYLDYLSAHPEEVASLYEDVLIDVTRFFRDTETWAYFEKKIVPRLLESIDRDTPIRIWSAGCATGEETYSLSMVLLDHIEKQGSRRRLQVFGSDLSQEALAYARRGRYPVHVAEAVPPARLGRYFHRVGEHYQIERPLRDMVTFAVHDLLADPPFANVDLVVCRNVLIYLEPPAQERLLELFNFSLRAKGILWLGSSETIGRRSDLFETLSSPDRFYRSVPLARAARQNLRHWAASRSTTEAVLPERVPAKRSSSVARSLERHVLRHAAPPAVAVDRSFEIVHFFGPTERYLDRPDGEARMDLLSWVKPGLYAKLRSGLLEARKENRSLRVSEMRTERDGKTVRVEASIELVPGLDNLLLVSFEDMPPLQQSPLDTTQPAPDPALLKELERELTNTQQELQSTVEQLETTNEDYRASHEELLSLNEELQSRNEELEMSKEELQSVNEELTIVNGQLEERNDEMRAVTADLNNLLVSSELPALFLDRQFRIRRYTPACTKLMDVEEADIGRSVDRIRFRFHDDQLIHDAKRVLDELVPVEAEISAGRQRWWARRILPYRTEEDRIDGVCITYSDVSEQKRANAESESARRFAEGIVESSRTPMLVLSEHLEVVMANRAFYETFHVASTDTIGNKIYDLGNRQWDIAKLRVLLEKVLPQDKDIRHYDVEHVFQSIGWRAMRLNANFLTRPDRPPLILMSIEDITDLRKAKATIQRRAEALAKEHRRKDQFLAMLGHELRNPLGALTSGIELLGRISGNPERLAETVAMMGRQAHRMRVLLDQILDVSRVISGKLDLAQDVLDVSTLIKAAVETIMPMIEASQQRLNVSPLASDEVFVTGDSARLGQVIENLLTNASKHSEPGSRIWVEATAKDERVSISVRDTGVGMEPEFRAIAFDLFTQSPRPLDRSKGGLGLGLSLARSIVEMHGGQVEARSEGLGKGSEFIVTLPRMRAERATSTSNDEATPRPHAVHRVLIVDDEVEATSMLTDILEMEGQRVRAAHSGPAALDITGEFHPDVALLDLGLPGMDGYELASKMREACGDRIRLIAVTGYERDDERLRRAGFDTHLIKPVTFSTLLDVIMGKNGDDSTSSSPSSPEP